MRLTSLALSNIKHNIKSYAVYFFAMCFSVFTTYSFLALIFGEHYNNEYYSIMFSVFGLVILAFILFFLMSSNKSFIKARKKEISTYALFGMDNGRIGRLLFLETLMLGTVALVVGIGCGIFFSKLIAMILIDMTMADYIGDVSFTINRIAIYITIGIFFTIFCMMGMSGRRVIKKFNLVDLFKASKVSEAKSKGSYIMLILSLALIACGYYWAWALDAMRVLGMLVTILLIVILGTHMFFWGGFQKLLHLLKKNKGHFYKDVNLISVSFLSHRAKTIATTMATIAILVASGTTAVSFGYSLFKSTEIMTYKENGFDVYFYAKDVELVDDVKALIEKHGLSIQSEVVRDIYTIEDKDVNFPITDGAYMAGHSLTVCSESAYNKVAHKVKADIGPIQIEKGGVTIAYNNYMMGRDWTNAKLSFSDRELPVLNVDGYAYKGGSSVLVIMDDEEFSELVDIGEITKLVDDKEAESFIGINYDEALNSPEVAKELKTLLGKRSDRYSIAYRNYNDFLQFFGQMCFIGFFMCVMLILMTASMLYFKQITIATEEKSQYDTLRRLGISEELERKAIKKRLLPVFIVPLLIGIVHSLFAMKAADTMFFTNMIPVANSYLVVLKTSAIMYLAYIVVYGAFYIITKNQYRRILNK